MKQKTPLTDFIIFFEKNYKEKVCSIEMDIKGLKKIERDTINLTINELIDKILSKNYSGGFLKKEKNNEKYLIINKEENGIVYIPLGVQIAKIGERRIYRIGSDIIYHSGKGLELALEIEKKNNLPNKEKMDEAYREVWDLMRLKYLASI